MTAQKLAAVRSTSTVRLSLPRWNVSRMPSAPRRFRCADSAATLLTGRSSAWVMRSPGFAPRVAARDPGMTLSTRMPGLASSAMMPSALVPAPPGSRSETFLARGIDQVGDGALKQIDRHREADIRRSARRRHHGGRHADQAASGIQQRPAGIAGIETGIGLDRVVDAFAVAEFDRTVQAADDATAEADA